MVQEPPEAPEAPEVPEIPDWIRQGRRHGSTPKLDKAFSDYYRAHQNLFRAVTAYRLQQFRPQTHYAAQPHALPTPHKRAPLPPQQPHYTTVRG
ncbi:hypothetical protein EB796_003818 [Bugula neritina]|uniref:Uncharacterized protein n=1 Tax=Bugula neritina TaxID=10212 RepID=A0A7J7KIW8_BUGNE|nr:hypothetical protein EB796_003818 [Bugula neritina]